MDAYLGQKAATLDAIFYAKLSEAEKLGLTEDEAREFTRLRDTQGCAAAIAALDARIAHEKEEDAAAERAAAERAAEKEQYDIRMAQARELGLPSQQVEYYANLADMNGYAAAIAELDAFIAHAQQAEAEAEKKAQEVAAAAAEAEKNKPWWQKGLDWANNNIINSVASALASPPAILMPHLSAIEIPMDIPIWKSMEIWGPVWDHVFDVTQTVDPYYLGNNTPTTVDPFLGAVSVNIGPLKVTSFPNGNKKYEITLPTKLFGLDNKIGIESGTIDGEQGIRTYAATSGVFTTPNGDVECETSFGDTALWRPKHILVPVALVAVVAIGYGVSTVLGPEGGTQVVQKGLCFLGLGGC